MTRGRLALLALALLAIAPRARAQAPHEREALDRLRDSIRYSTDTTGLLMQERALIEVARSERLEAMHHLRLGILALRLGELQPTEPHLDHALSEFEWAAELRPDWPWPWYGLGLAEARGSDRAAGFGGGLYTMLGIDRDRLSGNAFAHAIAVDPSFTAGLLEFGRVALDQRIDAPLLPALDAFRAATASPLGFDGALLLTRGRLERLAGHPDSARLAFQRAVLVALDPSEAEVELARTIPLANPIDDDAGTAVREATVRAYRAAAREDAPAALQLMRRDLEPIATEAELAAFDLRRGAARVAWLDQFWARRDAVDLRPAGSRLAEHFRRWDVARREFRLPPFRRRYRWGIETFQSRDAELDDRGIVYLRQGEPTLRIEWPKGRTANRVDPMTHNYGNESWRYDRPDGTITLHFVARDDPDDYRLVETPLELDVALDQLERRAHELPGLDRLIRAGEQSMAWVSEDVRRNGRASMAIATQTDSWQRQYRDILAGRAQWLAAGVRDGRPLVHIVYAIDAATLRAAADSSHGTVPVHVRAAFFDRAGRPVATLDTIQRFDVPSPDAKLVAARAEVPVRPGALRVKLGVELGPEQGVVFPVDSIVAPRPDAAALQLSAVLLGRAGVSLPWEVTPSDTAWLDAGGVYAPEDVLSLYAEAYGVRPGDRADVEIRITRQRTGVSRLFGARSTAISVSETVTASGPTLSLRRDLALSRLQPGTYALQVSVESGGRRIERRRGLVIQ